MTTPAQAEEPVEPVIVVVTTPGGDDSSYQVPLTTTVTFDGVVYDSVYATTNSVITFGNPDGTYWTYPSTPSISLYSMDWVVFPWARADEHLIISASDGGFQVDISARPIWLQNATEPTVINIVAAINTDGTVAISYSLAGPTYDDQTRTGVRLTSGDIVTLEEYGIVQVEEPPVLQPVPVDPTPTPTPEPPSPPSLNAPTGISAVANQDGSVTVSWNEPQPTSTGVERYSIGWSTDNFVNNGWGWVHDQTSVTIPLETFSQYGGLNNSFQFRIRADNDTLSTYSSYSEIASLYIANPVTPPTVPEGATLTSEGSTIQVIAPEGQQIVSIIAWYGDPADGSRGVEVSSTLTELATGQTSVTIESSNIYGDPAPGTVKTLIMVVVYGPIPEPVPGPTPSPTPSETPVIIVPEPTPTQDPNPAPTVDPEPEPTQEPVEPTPAPTIPSEGEPTPTPSETEGAIEEPEEAIVDETPTPEQSETPEPEPKPELRVEEAEKAIEELTGLEPEQLSDNQIEELKDAAETVLESAEQGSPEYEQALEALALAAEADDPEIPSELAAVPLLGDVAGAALEVFNNIGNVGADMAPAVREEAEKTVIASVIATGAAVNAVAAATTAASTTSSTGAGGTASSGGSGSSGSSSRRRE